MRLWNYFAGYVMIRVEGLSLEKFLNTALDLHIAVLDARRLSYTVLSAVVNMRGYKKLLEALSARYAITAEKKAGVAFGVKWLTRRKVLFFGLLLIAAAVFAASFFVFEVRVSGLEFGAAQALKEELSALGIYSGAFKGSIDPKHSETQLLIAHEEFAWINIRIHGAIAEVQVVLCEPVPQIVDDTRPCNIVAVKDAHIKRITARTGRALVKAGDTVRAGDVLISGLIWDAGLKRMLFAARGDVIGSVWYTASASAPLYKQTYTATGRTQTQRIIVIGADRADIDAACTFENFQTRVLETRDVVGLFLPVKILLLEHSETKLICEPVDTQIIKADIEERAYCDAAAKAQADVVAHVPVFSEQDGMLHVTVYVQTYEDIGKVVYLEDY